VNADVPQREGLDQRAMKSKRTPVARIYLETLGCAKNRVDSEIMLSVLLKGNAQWVESPEEATVIIINTCAFITPAVNESIERILQLARYKITGACQRLVVVGCLSERYRQNLLEEIPEIDAIMGTSDYTQIGKLVHSELRPGALLGRKPRYSEHNYLNERLISTGPHFAYVKIGEGCSNRCSFCNIPQLRGPYRSKPIGVVIEEIKRLLEAGYQEINLISQDCASYGIDQKPKTSLAQLMRSILDGNDREFWIRIFYAYPNRYPESLFYLMKADPRVVPYWDMPIQHIADPILKAMNRKIDAERIKYLIETARSIKDDIAIRTTLIVGFPGETEKEFKQLLDFVAEGHFQHLGVFVYCDEDNIQSHRYGDPVSETEKEERRQRIMEIQQAVSWKKNRAQIGQNQKVLIEGEYDETELLLKGRNAYQGVDVDGVVLINEGVAEAGKFHQVRITEAHPYDLIGKII